MIMDFIAATRSFALRIPREQSSRIQQIMQESGFDFSLPASSAYDAVLFTHEPYAAVQFADCATERARQELAPILAQVDLSRAPTSTANIACPPDKELWGFQKASISYALAREHCIIGDSPGLGKTNQAICFANEIRAKRVLVLCPAALRLQWAKAIREWSTMRGRYIVHPIMAGRHGVHPEAAWTIVSYDLARTDAIGRALAHGRYDLMVLDEAHFCKNMDSLRSRAIFGGGSKKIFEPLASRATRILALTGTPMPNRPSEAYNLARHLCFDAIDFMSEDKFNYRFNPKLVEPRVNPKTGAQFIVSEERTGRHAELQARLRANCMARHLKRDVMDQLKMPVYDVIQMETTGPVKQALQAESLLHIDPDDLSGLQADVLGHIAAARKQMGVALAPQIADYVDLLMDGGEEKLVVFAWHLEVLSILEKAWQKHGVIRMDGKTSAVEKQRRVDLFILDPSRKVILGNLLSMGTGVDGLQFVSNHAIIAEPDWNPGNNIQAFDRLDRGGQKRAVQGDIIVAPGSIAEKILVSALHKLQVTHAALDKR